jgi:putative ABC transport system substrate-binding protein
VKERGYIEGKNIAFLWRSADQKSSQADEIVREFVRERVAIIVASPTPAAHAARRGTATIPIVLSGIADPVSSGLVTSLARPGGNITGVSLNLPAVAGKRVEVLRDAFPALKRIAFLGSSSDPATKVFVANTEQAARQLGLALQVELIPGSSEINAAFIKIAAGGAQAVIVQPIFWTLAKQISELALKNRLPTISDFGSFPRDGGLLSYGPNQSATFLIVADYMDKILNGAKPGDLPIQEPTRFELVVNMKTARRLGIKIPDTVMVRADRVIE